MGKQTPSADASKTFYGCGCRGLLGAYRKGAGVLTFPWCVELRVHDERRVQHLRSCRCLELRPRWSTSHNRHRPAVAWDDVLWIACFAHPSYGVASVNQVMLTGSGPGP